MCLFRGHADAHKSSSSSLRLFQGSIFLKHSHIMVHSSVPGSFFFSHRISLSQSQQTTSTSTSHLFTGGITGIPPAFFPRKPKPFSNRPSPTPWRFFSFEKAAHDALTFFSFSGKLRSSVWFSLSSIRGSRCAGNFRFITK